MTYVLEMKTKIEGITKIGLIASHGFSCANNKELANDIFVRARAIHNIKNPSDIILCKKYESKEVADIIAKSMETKDKVYWRKNALV